MPDGTKPGGLFTVILRRFPEGWKIVHDHTSSEEAALRKPSSAPGPDRDYLAVSQTTQPLRPLQAVAQ